MRHLLVDKALNERLYIGFNRVGYVVTDESTGKRSLSWHEAEITGWEIKPYEPPKKKKRYWMWRVDTGGGWRSSEYYLDDLGADTNNSSSIDVYGEEWEDIKKEKIEDDYIDIEKQED